MGNPANKNDESDTPRTSGVRLAVVVSPEQAEQMLGEPNPANHDRLVVYPPETIDNLMPIEEVPLSTVRSNQEADPAEDEKFRQFRRIIAALNRLAVEFLIRRLFRVECLQPNEAGTTPLEQFSHHVDGVAAMLRITELARSTMREMNDLLYDVQGRAMVPYSSRSVLWTCNDKDPEEYAPRLTGLGVNWVDELRRKARRGQILRSINWRVQTHQLRQELVSMIVFRAEQDPLILERIERWMRYDDREGIPLLKIIGTREYRRAITRHPVPGAGPDGLPPTVHRRIVDELRLDLLCRNDETVRGLFRLIREVRRAL